MTTKPTYSKRSNAARAAIVSLGGDTPAKAEKATTGQDRAVSKRDKYGLRVGSKVSRAVAMFEKGCTMADVKEATGSPQYNMLKN